MSLRFHSATPILRILDVERARAFYVDYLGMAVDFEHRFEPGLPLYMQVSRDHLVLHLSEHHGDGRPGSTVYIATDAIRDFHEELRAKDVSSVRPSIETDEIGTSVTVIDPFGNTLRFNEPPHDRRA